MISRTIVDAAIRALQLLGRSAIVFEIYEIIVQYGFYEFGAKDPKSVLRVTLERHCKNKAISYMYQIKYFRKLIDGRYELIGSNTETSNVEEEIKAEDVERSIQEIHELAAKQRHKVKKEIIASLRALTPDKFEDFCRIFLAKYGFLEMKLTRKGRDGGIDVTGRLKIGSASMRVVVQCKKYAAENKIGRNSISAFRGDITGDFEQKIYMTTSSYTKEAEDVSFKPACIPIVLIDGE
ncbi:restriction endonuclease [Dryocola sp. BD586]|uniref:restriction endonuclease n=1 Tax=Dryocola sp. BD586 TaxID=3133271 RepID=UPI003F500045